MSLKELIDAKKQKAFTPEYRDKATDAEALGILVSQYFKWDGLEIMKAFSAALEDANFHGENKKIVEMIEKLEAE